MPTEVRAFLISMDVRLEVTAMLVLSRKRRERIRIGKDVVISIQQIRGQVVSVGIEAPRDIPVVRDELDDDPPPREKRVA